jgi:ABC-type branched-subunit amino acid transport system ATPase component
MWGARVTAVDERTPGATSTGTPVLRTEAVGKTFGGFVALTDVTVEARSAEVLGIIGPNGAGKTTLFNLIAGAFRPTAGRILLDGSDVTRLPPHRRVRRGIGRTFQLIRPFGSLTIRENVITAALGSGASMGTARERADAVLERLALDRIAGKSAADINAVEGKRLEVARALATEPRLILLDEIFSGLNSDEVDELCDLVHALRAESLCVLVIEHNVRAIRAVADRVVAIDAGRLVSEGDAEHVLSDPQVIESYLGHSSRT